MGRVIVGSTTIDVLHPDMEFYIDFEINNYQNAMIAHAKATAPFNVYFGTGETTPVGFVNPKID